MTVAHMRVEMGDVDSGRHDGVDLGAQLGLHGFGGGVFPDRRDISPEIAVLVGQPSRSRRRGQRAPAIGLLFAVERKMDAEVERRVRRRHPDRFGKPRARRHHRTGAACSHRRELREGRVGAVSHSDVVLVDHDDATPLGISGRSHNAPLSCLGSRRHSPPSLRLTRCARRDRSIRLGRFRRGGNGRRPFPAPERSDRRRPTERDGNCG